MTLHDIISKVIEDEGGDKVTNDPNDSGGRTQYGIAEASNPEAWADDVVTEAEARAIYTLKYITKPGFDKISDPFLQESLIECGVMSGPQTAVRILQRALNVAVDGQLGPATLTAVQNFPSCKVFGCEVPGSVALNLAFQKARVLHYARIVQQAPKNLKFLYGWQLRAYRD